MDKTARLAVSSELHKRLKRRARANRVSIQALAQLCIEHGLEHLVAVEENKEVKGIWVEGE